MTMHLSRHPTSYPTRYQEIAARLEQELGHHYRCGDYLLPDLTIPNESVTLGKYGRMRKTYLKEHKPILYNALLLSGKLTEHLIGVEAECRERLEILLPQMMQVEDVDEALKARDQMEWVRRMNSIQNRAEEILLNELVYA